MPKWINGNKSYIGFVGLGITLVLRGLSLMDNLQALTVSYGLPPDVDVFQTLMGFFGSLAGVGVAHKLAKAPEATALMTTLSTDAIDDLRRRLRPPATRKNGGAK